MSERDEASGPAETPRGTRALADLIAPPDGDAPEDVEDLRHLAYEIGAAAAAEQRSLAQAYDAVLEAAAARGLPLRGDVLSAVSRSYTDERMRRSGLTHGTSARPLSSYVSRLLALHRINRAATANLDLDALLNTVVRVVRDTIGADSCSVFLVDQSNGVLVLAASVGSDTLAGSRMILPLGSGIAGQAAAERRTIAVVDAPAHPAYVDYPTIGRQRYRAQVSVPLGVRGPERLVGVLNILALEPRAFDVDEIAFLETAAGEIAIAIENARLFRETDAQLQQRIAELSTLQRLSRMAASTLDLDELLRLVSEQAAGLAQARATEIYRRPRARPGTLDLLARYPGSESSVLDGLSAQVRAVVDEVLTSGGTVWRELSGGTAPVHVHALPMLTGRRAVGAICLFYDRRPPLADDTESLLYAFCDSAAIAIENAELYEEARRGYARASTLLQEMHHRVRNNLQTVAALLSMQARHAGDAAWATPLQEAVARIRSIAVVHEVLSGSEAQEATADVIVKHVTDEAAINVVPPRAQITFNVEPSDVRVASRQATALALLTNEFVVNAVEHGFPGRNRGVVDVRVARVGDDAVLEVRDDGQGLPPGFDPARDCGLGLRIARTLAEVDLRGRLELLPRPEGGTLARVRFTPEPAEGAMRDGGPAA